MLLQNRVGVGALQQLDFGVGEVRQQARDRGVDLGDREGAYQPHQRGGDRALPAIEVEIFLAGDGFAIHADHQAELVGVVVLSVEQIFCCDRKLRL